jgi:hypothetical protein
MTPLGSWLRIALQPDTSVDVAKVDPRPLRLLVVSAGVAGGGQLRSWLAGEVDGRSVVMRVVSPALAGSRLKYLTSDADEGIRKATQRLEQSVFELNRSENTIVSGEVGEADPVLAIEDALVSFPAEEIVLVVPPGGECQWAARNLLEKTEKRFDLPVKQIEL